MDGGFSNFAMGTILGKGFAQAQVPKARVLPTVYARVLEQNPFPKLLSPWQNGIP